jgi:DNA repair exonuclease SbcCD ATPase subunit
MRSADLGRAGAPRFAYHRRMGYRDELEAANARVEQLQDEIRALHDERERGKKFDRSAEPLSPVPGVRNKLLDSRERARAAEARIAELEAQVARLEGAGNADAAALREDLARAEARARRLEEDLARERRLAAPRSTMPTVVERNRGFAPEGEGKPAGVLCPLCMAVGDRVEMRARPHRFADAEMPSAFCPRCRYAHAFPGGA